MLGLRAPLKLAQFKPALAMNSELQARYAANRLRVVRQVRTHHDDIIDLVLFLNGLPVATVELKSEFTQGINEAVDQYQATVAAARLWPGPRGCGSVEGDADPPQAQAARWAAAGAG